MPQLTSFWRRSPVVAFVLVWASLALTSLAWAGATPLSGAPDEPAHIIKAVSVVRGEFLGEPTDEPAMTRVQVPAGFATLPARPCFARDATIVAACAPPVGDSAGLAPATTTAGLYNPVYYLLVGWPSLVIADTSTAIYAMRAVSALLSTFLTAVAVMALSRFIRRRWVLPAAVVACTPMVFFLFGVVNPNSLEVSGTFAVVSLLLALVRGAVGLTVPVTVALSVSGFLLGSSRGLSPLWLGVAGLVALCAAAPGVVRGLLGRWRSWVVLVVLAVGVVFAVAWSVSTETLGRMGNFPGAGVTPPIEAFWHMLLDRTFDPGYVGLFGWLDTFPSGGVLAVWAALVLGVVGFALVSARGRLLVALVIAVLALVLVPPLAQAASVQESGYIWQGRYALAGLVIVVLIAGVALAESPGSVPRWPGASGRRMLGLVAGAVVLSQVFAFVVALKRYIVGADATWSAFLLEPVWAPPLGAVFWVILCAVGVIAFVAVTLVAVALPLRESQADDPEKRTAARTAQRGGELPAPERSGRG